MAPALDLRDIQALTSLQTALSGFSDGLREALSSGRSDILGRLEWMQAKVQERKQTLEEVRSVVEMAEADLYTCEHNGLYTPEGYYIPLDCSLQATNLQRARQLLEKVEKRLENAQAWQMRLQQAAAEFDQMQSGLERLAADHTSQARNALGQLAERYAAVHSMSVSTPLPAAQSTVRSSQWLQRGMVSVKMPSLPAPEGISSAADFSKVSESEMRAGLQRFQEMRPTIENGAGNNSDYWADQDRQRGLEYANGYQRIYDAFYGRDAIQVEKNGDNYDIINGRHRIWLAKQMGIDNLPMRVVEKES